MKGAIFKEQFLDPTVLAAIGRLDLIARTVVEGFLIGLHKSPYRGFSQEFAEHRPYIAGDEMRRIDWRVYGRTDRLYVKEFESETNAPVRLLLDVSGSMGFSPRGQSKLDYAKYLAASLAYLANRQNDRVGLVCFSNEVRKRVGTRGGERHLHTLFAALESVEASGTADLGQVLMREAAQWQRRGLAIVISDLYDEPQSIVDSIARIRRVGHDVIVFHLLDRTEILLDRSGQFEFHDLETGELMIADIGRIRRDYVKRIELSRAFFKREFQREGADFAEVDPSEPLDSTLSAYLRRRKASACR